MAIIRSGKLIGVCVHHSAVKPGAENITELKQRANSYNTTHSKKTWAETIKTPAEYGYPYIEYHYMIAKDGSLLQVQDEKYVLYHAGDNVKGDSSFNLHGIAVMIDGNYEEEIPNDNQMLTLVKLIRDIQTRYKIDAMVRGHKETSETATSCPGKNIGIHTSGWLKQVIQNVNNSNYPVVAPVEDPQITELKKQVDVLNTSIKSYKASEKSLKEQITTLQTELEETKKILLELQNKYDSLYIEKNRIENEKNELTLQLQSSGLKNISVVELFTELWRRITTFKKNSI